MEEELNNEAIGEQNESIGVENISCCWLPIFELVLSISIIITTFSLFLKQGLFNKKEWPTISETARKYPQCTVFAVGLSVLGVLFLILGLIMLIILYLNGIQWAKKVAFVPFVCCLLLICMSCCGLNDQPFVHGTFAISGFIFILIFIFIVHIGMIQAKKITCKMFKTIILASGVIMVIVLAILTPMKETSFVCCSKAIVEYVLVVSLFLYIATWVSDIRQFSFALLVSIPLQEADSESV